MTSGTKAKPKATKGSKLVDAYIAQAWRDYGAGVQINMLDIPEIWERARKAAAGAGLTHLMPHAISESVKASVEAFRKN
jgi:hypothetical protein